MASKFDSIRLTREQDRRYKLSEEQIAEMRRLYADGVNGPELSRRFGVSANCVYYHVNDDRKAKARASMKEYNLVRPPRPRAERTAYARELRSYKRKLLLEVRDGEM